MGIPGYKMWSAKISLLCLYLAFQLDQHPCHLTFITKIKAAETLGGKPGSKSATELSAVKYYPAGLKQYFVSLMYWISPDNPMSCVTDVTCTG